MSYLLSEFILGVKPEYVREKVVIAPCWMPDSVGITELTKIGSGSCQVWDCALEGRKFTYIVTGVGAASCMDIVFALAKTACQSILFIGSAGALRKGINIGDFAVPNGVLSAEGASRYIGNDLTNDVFGKCFFSTNKLQRKIFVGLRNQLKGQKGNVYEGVGISVESILLQYEHMEEILNMKSDFIDMESSAFLAACNSNNIQCAVVFCISDNIAQNEPLYNISNDKTDHRKKIRNLIMPFVLKEFIYGF